MSRAERAARVAPRDGAEFMRTTKPHGNPTTRLLGRLDHVTGGNGRWRARCPAHGGENPSALSIRELDDGRVLVNCFGGCSSQDVVEAVGLTLGDLFPDRPAGHWTPPAERERWAAVAAMREARDLILDVLRETSVAWCAAKQLAAGDPLDEIDTERLELAASRLHAMQEALR